MRGKHRIDFFLLHSFFFYAIGSLRQNIFPSWFTYTVNMTLRFLYFIAYPYIYTEKNFWLKMDESEFSD